MPNPETLKIGDMVRFVDSPAEWSEPGYYVHQETLEFMAAMIARKSPSRIAEICRGMPTIHARVRGADGEMHDHRYAITEQTGWRLVQSKS